MLGDVAGEKTKIPKMFVEVQMFRGKTVLENTKIRYHHGKERKTLLKNISPVS